MGRNGNLDGFVSIIVIIYVVGTPYGVPLLDFFVGFLRSEARLMFKSTKKRM